MNISGTVGITYSVYYLYLCCLTCHRQSQESCQSFPPHWLPASSWLSIYHIPWSWSHGQIAPTDLKLQNKASFKLSLNTICFDKPGHKVRFPGCRGNVQTFLLQKFLNLDNSLLGIICFHDPCHEVSLPGSWGKVQSFLLRISFNWTTVCLEQSIWKLADLENTFLWKQDILRSMWFCKTTQILSLLHTLKRAKHFQV